MSKTGEFGGEATLINGVNGSFLSWAVAKARVAGKVFPITGATGPKGTEAAAVYNLGHGGFRSAVGYVYNNIVRQVLVDSGRQGVEYTLAVDVRGFGAEKGFTMNLNQMSRGHTLANKKAAAYTFAALIVNAAVSSYYTFLSNAGWKAAASKQAPETLVEDSSKF